MFLLYPNCHCEVTHGEFDCWGTRSEAISILCQMNLKWKLKNYLLLYSRLSAFIFILLYKTFSNFHLLLLYTTFLNFVFTLLYCPLNTPAHCTAVESDLHIHFLPNESIRLTWSLSLYPTDVSDLHVHSLTQRIYLTHMVALLTHEYVRITNIISYPRNMSNLHVHFFTLRIYPTYILTFTQSNPTYMFTFLSNE